MGSPRAASEIEPNVAIETEYALHGLVARNRALRLGVVVRQRCDARGAWLSSEPIAGVRCVADDVGDRLVEESRRVAGALAAAGYFGPFGVDAYTYRDRGAALCLQPRSEINARYSMGFAVGFGRPGDNGSEPARASRTRPWRGGSHIPGGSSPDRDGRSDAVEAGRDSRGGSQGDRSMRFNGLPGGGHSPGRRGGGAEPPAVGAVGRAAGGLATFAALWSSSPCWRSFTDWIDPGSSVACRLRARGRPASSID